METKMKIGAELDFYRAYTEKCLPPGRPGRGKPRIYTPAEMMEYQADMVEQFKKRMLEETFSTYVPRPWPLGGEFIDGTGIEALKRTVHRERLLRGKHAFDPIWVDYEDKPAFFDESEKLVPTPKKRVWYHQTPQILGRTYGFIFKPEAGQ